jgi:hypothetical protein
LGLSRQLAYQTSPESTFNKSLSGWILTIILSILNLFALPLGTALGIYGFWVLTQPEAVQILEGRSAS